MAWVRKCTPCPDWLALSWWLDFLLIWNAIFLLYQILIKNMILIMNSLLCSIDPCTYSCLCEVGHSQCQCSSQISVGPFLVFVSEYFEERALWVWAFSSLHIQVFLGGCLQLPLSSPKDTYRCGPPITSDQQVRVYENPFFSYFWHREPFINKPLAHNVLIAGSAFGKLHLR